MLNIVGKGYYTTNKNMNFISAQVFIMANDNATMKRNDNNSNANKSART